jgi:CelD/BcsL family acetyltransferase involved in cellulose biosynthesis
MGQARRRAAKAQSELGPVRFEADIIDEKVLQRLVELKRAQYASTGARDYFTDARRGDLLLRLLHTRDPEFAGILSTLYAGRHLLAAHFGIRSGAVLHWWFPVYDPVFAYLSPGWILLRELVAAAPRLGITRIDLGRGEDEYKRRAKTGEILVSQGVVTSSSTRRVLRRTGRSIVAAAKSSPLAPGLRLAVRKFDDSTSELSSPFRRNPGGTSLSRGEVEKDLHGSRESDSRF